MVVKITLEGSTKVPAGRYSNPYKQKNYTITKNRKCQLCGNNPQIFEKEHLVISSAIVED
jgi:hypothetical protein